jgi:AraC-like DNA-binding protein
MVSMRCKIIVRYELEKLQILHGIVELGKVDIPQALTFMQMTRLRTGLMLAGLELMDDRKAILIENIKVIIIEMVHYSDETPSTNLSVHLSERLGFDYTYLANLFSEVTGTTIENYVIAHKIERAKELLLYDELNLSEISLKLNYKSVAHLSHQFKKITGLTATYFKKIKQFKKRISLENV